MKTQYYKNFLEQKGVIFEEGLSEEETVLIEQKYDFKFPPDLREFLSLGLPVSDDFINWRSDSEKSIRGKLDWPYDSMCFDVENDEFWLPEWGKKPQSHEKACEIVKKALDKMPKLIPICSHRYIPDTPCEAGNPVFSVYQTDIIYYGRNLGDYLEIEFDRSRKWDLQTGYIKQIEFWSEFAEGYIL
ncbi:hypothetical protein ASJ33_01540 [Dehalococcoides mccartyi]|jgi:hypothetical protein|uniref:hypothetical protein n=1 Tax=Dehalococcoides mccartyi TaxID=61435 RepID=UPI0004E0505B|nr:hypothetical protein [Dehalococcoides mccartyi]AII57433.1 hypothetical protein X792_01265 [Dehalococcoides mccartyi CG1]APH11926.1 hypothetical protein ASJ33_01540 [Dehalococcoides mccartyi]